MRSSLASTVGLPANIAARPSPAAISQLSFRNAMFLISVRSFRCVTLAFGGHVADASPRDAGTRYLSHPAGIDDVVLRAAHTAIIRRQEQHHARNVRRIETTRQALARIDLLLAFRRHP